MEIKTKKLINYNMRTRGLLVEVFAREALAGCPPSGAEAPACACPAGAPSNVGGRLLTNGRSYYIFTHLRYFYTYSPWKERNRVLRERKKRGS